MNNEISEEQTSRRHTPEERALILRLRLYVQARWLVIIGVIGATLIATLVFQIGFPTLPVYIICTVIALYNLLLYYWTQRLKAEETGFVIKKAETYGNIQIFLDLLTLTVLIHYTGGIENPLVFFYLAHTITAGIVLPKRRAYEIATLAMLMVTLLVFLEYANVIPHVNLDGFVLPYRYEQLSRVLAVLVTLTALVYGCTYLVTAISRELRYRQQETVKLKDQLIEKRTMELEQISGEVAKLEDERRRFVQFLGVVAHDLQSPLVATQSIMSYILDGYTGEITDGQRDLLERGVRRIDGLLTLITDLLDIPRIEGGQVTREMREISLNEVVKSAVDGLDKMALQKGITLKIELSESLPKIHGAGRRLQQVVTNLVSNAINYSHEGTVLVRVTDNTSDVRIEVIDSGIGIPPEDLPQLFKDFVRGSNVGIKGTGLGLSISKRIVEAHGGRIWAESPDPETHEGSRFTFTLPKKQMAVHEEKQE
ncbi:MAG: HAMP domain-containing histidine kinase [Dehalococcoidia bacterium]|nr:HAMP domain-containing histidine kinase [Dehalococcoidia bacterium]